MIGGVLTLFKTLFDIIRLQKGPEAIPYSPVLFTLVVAAWISVGAVVTALIVELDQTDFAISLLLSVIALVLYSALVVFSSNSSRLLQTITAILGCGALLEILFVTGHLLLTPILGKSIAALINYLILLWSIPVEGHIISRAIGRDWYVGFLIAITVFLIQIQLSTMINPTNLASP